MSIPISLKNYALSVFNIDLLKYSLTILPTTTIFSCIRIYIAHTAKTIFELIEHPKSVTNIILLIFSIILTLGITLYISYFCKK